MRVIVLALTAIASILPASASTVTLTFSGTLDAALSSGTMLSFDVAAFQGQTVKGSYVFDDSVVGATNSGPGDV